MWDNAYSVVRAVWSPHAGWSSTAGSAEAGSLGGRREVAVSKTFSIVAILALALSLTGCNGAFWGNLLVLGVTVGIFFGTLALGRASAATRSADASSSTQSSGRR